MGYEFLNPFGEDLKNSARHIIRMLPKCMICLERVSIPVEILAFPCCEKLSKNPYSMTRFCEACVIKLLELDKEISEKSSKIKCLFGDCEITVIKAGDGGSMIWKAPLYKKDYMLMSMDTDSHTCSLCLEWKGTHLDLEKHVHQECSKREQTCECGVRFFGPDWDLHKKECEFFKTCPVCEEMVCRVNLTIHLQNKHSMIVCTSCEQATTSSIAEHLKDECGMRIIKCDHCSFKTLAKNYLDHLMGHAQRCKERIALLRDMVSTETTMFDRLSSDLKKVAEKTFRTPIDTFLEN